MHKAFDIWYINVIETDDSSRGETTLPVRRTMDTVTNASGHKLLKSCLSSDVRIINGRINDIGQYTYVSTNCNSIMDYVLVSEELFPFINNFTVQDMHSFSPHLTISVYFKLLQLEIPKLDTIVNHIVGNNVDINIGIDHSSHILYKRGVFEFFGKQKL